MAVAIDLPEKPGAATEGLSDEALLNLQQDWAHYQFVMTIMSKIIENDSEGKMAVARAT